MIQLTQVPQTDEDLFGSEQRIEERAEEFVIFRLSAEWYALRVGEVREVVRLERITALPEAAAPVIGVINLRGSVLPVSDPKPLLGLASGTSGYILVLGHEAAAVGFCVDEVRDVAAVPLSRLEPPLATLNQAQPIPVTATFRWDDRLIAILDGDRCRRIAGDGIAQGGPAAQQRS